MKTMRNIKEVRFYVGLDVHKKSTTYAVRDKLGNIVLEGECATIYQDLHQILEPYLFSCRIGLEASTSYYKLYKEFLRVGSDTRVANVIQIRKLIAKNDKLDAKRLAEMLRLNSFPESYIPDDKIQSLRNLIRLRHQSVVDLTRTKNQIHAILDKEGIIISCTKDTFTKTWCNKLLSLINQNIGGIELKYAYDYYKIIAQRYEEMTMTTSSQANELFPEVYTLLQSIDGIGYRYAPYIISEACPIARFPTPKKLRRYAGVVPCFHESGDKISSGFLPKYSSRPLLKWALIGAARCAVKKKGNKLASYYKIKKKQKGSSKAIVAVASSLCDIIYHVLTTKKPYNTA